MESKLLNKNKDRIRAFLFERKILNLKIIAQSKPENAKLLDHWSSNFHLNQAFEEFFATYSLKRIFIRKFRL
jgi:hypothetical protein